MSEHLTIANEQVDPMECVAAEDGKHVPQQRGSKLLCAKCGVPVTEEGARWTGSKE